MEIEIRALQAQLEEVDDRFAELFETRMTLSAQIAVLKAQAGLPLDDELLLQQTVERLAGRMRTPVAAYLPLLYEALFELTRDYQAFVLED